MKDSEMPGLRGYMELTQAIKVFGYCIVASTVIPTFIVVTYLNGDFG